jgi:hypothetical protein
MVVVEEPQAETPKAMSATAANFHMAAIYVRHLISERHLKRLRLSLNAKYAIGSGGASDTRNWRSTGTTI